MADVLSMNGLFNPELVRDLFSKVTGKSSVAALCGQTPIAFTGNEIMTFSMDDEVMIVGENQKKERGSVTLDSVKIIPLKVEYGARVSNEFQYATEEKQMDILGAFNDGYAKKIAKGLDLMAFHKVNPRTGSESDLINSAFTQVTNTVDYDADAPDDCLQNAIVSLGDYDCTGIAMSKNLANALGKMKGSMGYLYPELAFGAQASTFFGNAVSVNSTVSYDEKTQAILGDFSAFRWGYVKQIPFEVIPYGDPDNTGTDLKGSNQVYLRAETYLGWAIIDPAAFCKIEGAADTAKTSVKTTSAKADK